MPTQIRGSPAAKTPNGSIAARMQDNLINMAEDLERGKAITEERRTILRNLFAQVWDINALETQMPLYTKP